MVFVLNKYKTVNAGQKTIKLYPRGTQIITVQSYIINWQSETFLSDIIDVGQLKLFSISWDSTFYETLIIIFNFIQDLLKIFF